jgi:hypothetical protein
MPLAIRELLAKDSDHGHLVVVKFADHFAKGRRLCLLHVGGAR